LAWADYYLHKTDKVPVAPEPSWATTKAGTTDKYGIPSGMPQSSNDPIEQGWIDRYNDQADVKRLDEMAKEEMYIDLGMGAAESKPNSPVKGTYFNSALSGLNFTDYSVDADGDPKNLALIMQELADVFDNWDEDGQKYIPDQYKDMSYTEFQDKMEHDVEFADEINKFHEEYQAKAYRLMDKLKAGQEHTTEMWVELNANSVYLQTAEKQLTIQKSDLNTQILDIEQVDLADAITTFSWQQYCYNSALKIGNQLLSQTLIDYMR